MKKIPLTRGQFAIVDDEDFDWLNQWPWTCSPIKGNTMYAYRGVGCGANQSSIFMHRQIADPKKGQEVDHINGDGLDNRRSNLRVCFHWQNIRNCKMHRRNTSGFRGVHFDKERNKWYSHVKIKGVIRFVGRFDTKIEAARRWNEVVLEHYGQFARLNQI